MPDFNEIIGEMYLALNEEALVASVVRTVKLSGDVWVEINLSYAPLHQTPTLNPLYQLVIRDSYDTRHDPD
jgi:hypothetical protein